MPLATDRWEIGSVDPLAAILSVIAIVVSIIALVSPYVKERRARRQLADIHISDHPGDRQDDMRAHVLLIENRGVAAATNVTLDVSWPDVPIGFGFHKWKRASPQPQSYSVLPPNEPRTSTVEVPNERDGKFRITVSWVDEGQGQQERRINGLQMVPQSTADQ